jgi:hypothetical protein
MSDAVMSRRGVRAMRGKQRRRAADRDRPFSLMVNALVSLTNLVPTRRRKGGRAGRDG